ncbi:MAG: NADH-quinone oxidoreductase subunit [Acidimicrobiaceae bacterium]|nr:NADH-quinone oxidoreductase subunit [Acidimicrobiaceae bacterium]
MSSEAEAAPVPVPVDEVRQRLLATLADELGDAVVGSEVAGGDITVRVSRDRWHDAVAACRDKLGMDYFCFLSSLDWYDNPSLAGEKAWGSLPDEEADASGDEADAGADAVEAEADADADAGGAEADVETTPAESGPATGVAGGDTRFQVFCRLYSTVDKIGITLKADLDDDQPQVQSIVDLYRGADWHERESWEMYGFDFVGHPGLRHIYLPGGFEGHPGRKDFPLLAREVKPWPGLVDVEPLPAGADGESEEAAAE